MSKENPRTSQDRRADSSGETERTSDLAALRENLKRVLNGKLLDSNRPSEILRAALAIVQNQKDTQELQIVGLILEAINIHEDSWVDDHQGELNFGKYTVDEQTAFYRAAEKYPKVKTLAFPLYLANHWTNDLQEWCMAVLLGEYKECENAAKNPCENSTD
jgi:hypothetical protein